MNFKGIDKLLRQYQFFGFTVKRNGARLCYTYRSVAYYAIIIKVDVIKVNPETFGCKKMVAKVTISEKEVNDLTELVNALKNIYKVQKEEREKLYKKI